MSTPHNKAALGDIAKTVLMPGDPLRAKFIAETYLENPVCFNTVRNMLGFTGTYKGKKITVMGSGMGMPSIGIYSYELFHTYDVYTIADYGLLTKAVEAAEKLGVNVKVGNILSSDIFYDARPDVNQRWARMGVMAAEMEAAALYMNAAYAHKHALCLLTVSDQLLRGESLSPDERQVGFDQMMRVALELA